MTNRKGRCAWTASGAVKRLEPEWLRRVQHAFVTACSDRVAHYEGHIAPDPGDALLTYCIGEPT